ncbi:MAG: peptidoglycan bridge formation glycyltransferase FemA/FemB family protein [Deltaproteobacteria bacterium]
MKLGVTPKEKCDLQPGPFFQQTVFWGRLKELHGCEVLAFDLWLTADCDLREDKANCCFSVHDDFLIVLRPVGSNYLMAYIPYGPSLEPPEELQGSILEELSENLRRYLPDNCLFIRYDLPWQSPWAREKDNNGHGGRWRGAPRPEIQELRMNFSTARNRLRKAQTNILPSNTVFLDLDSTQEQILRQMKSKTRYNIRLSLRKGVRIIDAGPSYLDTWYRLYQETARRNSIALHDYQYFQTIFAARAGNANRHTTVCLLLAVADGLPLAGMFLGLCDRQAVYLYGASSSRKRNKMASYALQWEAICRAKRHGCRYYDMFGVSPSPDPSHPMFGLYRFKTGFGGSLFHRQGCWDYPLRRKDYTLYRTQELNDQGYHLRKASP